jgi:acetyltransferase
VDEVRTALGEDSFPVALKVDHEAVIHKSDEGGVALDLADADELQDAARKMASRFGERGIEPGFVVQQYLVGGREVIMGIKDAAGAGSMVMVGTGGIYTEVLGDAQFKLAPVTRDEARGMLQALRGFPILAGTRGEKSVDLDALVDILVRLGALAADQPEIVEMDLNPVLAFGQKGRTAAVDARIRVER